MLYLNRTIYFQTWQKKKTKIRMEKELISESKTGNIDQVKQILESGDINIICEDIPILKLFIIWIFDCNQFIVFQFFIFFMELITHI